jgi:23S rRNA (guanosine2251-2'-O)-methyltransferase
VSVTVILDNVRSLYNVGAIMRVCDGAGVTRLIATGITPYPSLGADDPRRGPVAARADRELRKTALAAMDPVKIEHFPTPQEAISRLRTEGATIIAIETTTAAQSLWNTPALDAPHLALLFGHETEGLSPEALALADVTISIPMRGAGKSLNVSTAAAIVLYEVLRRQSHPS